MPALLDPPDGWGYPEPEKTAKSQDEEYAKDDFDLDSWVDEQIDQLREDEMQDVWESNEYENK